MYKQCPKCGHQQPESAKTEADRCPACGLIYAKWLKQRFQSSDGKSSGPSLNDRPPLAQRLEALFLSKGESWSSFQLYGRMALFVVLMLWGWHFILMDHTRLLGGLPEINYSIMHSLNLVFHEGGHVIFMPFGRFLSILGGSLTQLLFPIFVILAFLRQQNDPFAASVGLWWLGQSLMDLAPYIHDARAGQMTLLGGFTGSDRPGYHDWHNILGDLGLLEQDHGLAVLVNGLGIILMLLAFAWGGFMLMQHWRARH